MILKRIAIIGFGLLGQACAKAIGNDAALRLVGVVRQPHHVHEPLAEPFQHLTTVSHISELGQLDAALICVPTQHALGIAHDIMQHGTAIVECANIHGQAFLDHKEKLDRFAILYKTTAIVGAGWDPGAVSIFRSLFAVLTPKGHTDFNLRPGINLHHSSLVHTIAGVRKAMSTELRTNDGRLQRYVYVEMERGADFAQIEQAILGDPLFLDSTTQVFAVDDITTLEDEGHGVLLERRGSAAGSSHQLLLLESRCCVTALAAQIMIAAAHTLPSHGHHAFSLFDLPLSTLWGELRKTAEAEWI